GASFRRRRIGATRGRIEEHQDPHRGDRLIATRRAPLRPKRPRGADKTRVTAAGATPSAKFTNICCSRRNGPLSWPPLNGERGGVDLAPPRARRSHRPFREKSHV